MSRRTLIVGFRGAVGQAVVRLLATHPAADRLRRALGETWLCDAQDGPRPALASAHVLPPSTIRSAADLHAILITHRITECIDLAGLDTLACGSACVAAGASYLCTSLESWPHARVERRTIVAAKVLLPAYRPAFSRSVMVGAGMNPGIVNALVPYAIDRFVQRTGVADAQALGLRAVFITEEDSTHAPVPPDVFPMTWSPQACLAELLEPNASYYDRSRATDLPHAPLQARYRARVADRIVDGYVVPHEEVVTIGARHGDLQVAFVYRLPPAARRFLARTRVIVPGKATARLHPPHAIPQSGDDRVGVLLATERHGELWVGFCTDVAQGIPWHTNATALQVAAGVIAAWQELGRVHGVHTVDDLDPTQIIDRAQAMLGPIVEVYDPHVPFTPLVARRIAEPSACIAPMSAR